MLRLPNIKACYRALFGSAALGLLCWNLIGCGSSSVAVDPTPTPPSTYSGPAVSGVVKAGAAVVSGASVQIYTAGTTGNGSAPAALLTSPLVSDATGKFTVPAGYKCPSATSELYLLARGGAPVPSTSSNSAIVLLAAVGYCNAPAAASGVVINELTTVAATWSLSQFLSSGGNIGSTATNSTGLANAFATAANLASITTGSAPGANFPSTGSAPVARIGSLANLLNLCTSSGSPTSKSCADLFAQATQTGASSPSNTLDAALGIARNPGANVAALYALSATGKAFAPALTAAPADWTLPATFTGGTMNGPAGLGVDSAGNVWVGSYFGVASKFSPTGVPAFPSGITGSGLNSSYGLAIDPSDNVWITNQGSPSSVNGGFGSVTVLNPAGQPISGATGYAAGGLNYPISIAIDPNGTAWVVDYGNSRLTLLSASGQPISGATGYSSDLFAFPVAVALDSSHNGWIANQAGTALTRVSPDGKQITNFACCNGPSGLAIDGAGNVWAANYYGDSISAVSSSGSLSSSGYTGGGLNHPQGIAVDGAGSVWAVNFLGASVTQLAGSGTAHPGQPVSPAQGWASDAGLLKPFSVAIDASGNIWVTNFGNNTLTELIGLAAPVRTPMLGPPRSP